MSASLQINPAPLGFARSVQEGEHLLQYLPLPHFHLGSLSRPLVRGGLIESFLSLYLSPSAKLAENLPKPTSSPEQMESY